MAGGLFCSSGGCTAKLGPDILERVLSRIERGAADPNLLVGFDSSDDAAVYRVSDEVAVVQTLDFFPPMLEDPYVFGQIAATNALILKDIQFPVCLIDHVPEFLFDPLLHF